MWEGRVVSDSLLALVVILATLAAIVCCGLYLSDSALTAYLHAVLCRLRLAKLKREMAKPRNERER